MTPPVVIELGPQRPAPKARLTAAAAKRRPRAGRTPAATKRRRNNTPRRGSQLPLAFKGRGGSRDGAGRPKKPGSGVAHLRRAKLSRHQPVHVNWKVVEGLPSLRRKRLMRVIERAFEQSCQRLGMRLVHYSVQSRHMHLICEATGERALSRGMQGLGIRLAKALNRALGRKGKVFADRFHSHVLKTPREVRNALRYVLGNARRHAFQRGELMPEGALDPCSSGRYFDGFHDRDQALVVAAWMDEAVPVAPARCWLLTTGWKRDGLLAIDAVPGQPTRRRRQAPKG